jgi:hypothetical protein
LPDDAGASPCAWFGEFAGAPDWARAFDVPELLSVRCVFDEPEFLSDSVREAGLFPAGLDGDDWLVVVVDFGGCVSADDFVDAEPPWAEGELIEDEDEVDGGGDSLFIRFCVAEDGGVVLISFWDCARAELAKIRPTAVVINSRVFMFRSFPMVVVEPANKPSRRSTVPHDRSKFGRPRFQERFGGCCVASRKETRRPPVAI